MPLSEHEERILAEIERQLAEEDPRFVARARSRRLSLSRGIRMRIAIACIVLGVVGVMMLTFSFAVGAVGMALLVTGVLLGVSASREDDPRRAAGTPPDDRA